MSERRWTQGRVSEAIDAARVGDVSAAARLAADIAIKMQPIRTIDGDEIRKRALANLALRLGREPTAADIDAERTAEAQRQPMPYVIASRPHEALPFRIAARGTFVNVLPSALILPPAVKIEV